MCSTLPHRRMDCTSDKSSLAAYFVAGVNSDDFQEEIAQYQEEVAQYLDTMSHRAYAEHETTPFPPYMGNPYGSQYYDRYVHPAGLPGPPMTTLSVPLVDRYHSSSSARAYASSPPYSDTTTLVASPCTSNWDSPIPESYEDTSMYPHQAQRSYGNPVDSPVHSPLPHVVYARHPSTSLHSRGLYSASGSVTTRDYLASGYVADGPPRVGNRELQHDGGRSAAMYDTCHGWDIGVAADASTTASTSTASYDSAPNSATLPQSKTRSGRGRRSRQETSEPDVGAPSLAKPFACAYDDCKYGENSFDSNPAPFDATMLTSCK